MLKLSYNRIVIAIIFWTGRKTRVHQTAGKFPAIFLLLLGLHKHCIHTGPIIRQEDEYRNFDIQMRRRIFNKMVAFVKQLNIRYKAFYIEKKHNIDVIEATGKLAKYISNFIKENYQEFLSYTYFEKVFITASGHFKSYVARYGPAHCRISCVTDRGLSHLTLK